MVILWLANTRTTKYYETWLHRSGDAKQLGLITVVSEDCWHQVTNPEVQQRVFKRVDDNSIGVTTLKYQHRSFEHVLRMSSQWIVHDALFVDAVTG